MPIRVLAVDDFEPWRRFVSSALGREPDVQTILEVSDGLEAVSRVEELRPDLILLDIGLPGLDGISAARRIRGLSPNSKILFLSEESSSDVAEAALEAGGDGYLVKSDAGRELLAAVKAVLNGEQFISARLVGRVFFDVPENSSQRPDFHKLQIYSSDTAFVDGFTRFIVGGLNAGNSVVVLATEAHRLGLAQRLRTLGFSLDAASKSGTYISLDAAEMLASFMHEDEPDTDKLWTLVGGLVEKARKAPNGATRRVLACGELAPSLWAQSKVEAALKVEKLWDAASHRYGLSTLCGYLSDVLRGVSDQRAFQALRSVHSIVIPDNFSAQLI
ncbi:MAG TPA: response regulator [Terriglobales bacterium]|jgi:DNA-binding NarL/FixJ family response regulator|nr:response regulator [Terriglobales bacterium]